MKYLPHLKLSLFEASMKLNHIPNLLPTQPPPSPHTIQQFMTLLSWVSPSTRGLSQGQTSRRMLFLRSPLPQVLFLTLPT